VLSLAWVLSGVGNIWIVGQGEARHTHAFRIVSRPRFSVMRVRLAAGVPQSSGRRNTRRIILVYNCCPIYYADNLNPYAGLT